MYHFLHFGNGAAKIHKKFQLRTEGKDFFSTRITQIEQMPTDKFNKKNCENP